MKKLICKPLGLLFAALSVFTFMTISNTPAFADSTIDNTYKQNQAAYTNYKDCIRLYKLPYGKLYFIALSAVNANNYEILEMQSRNGYIIFKAEGREFLLDILAKNKSYTYLKLTPCDNNYFFNPQIPFKIFHYTDLHFNADIKELKI